MKRILFSLALVLFSMAAFSQVGIGTTTPNASASLDLGTSGTNGLLLNRVILTSTGTAAPVTNAVAGMVVYNTSATITGTAAYPSAGAGVYTWDGTGWVNGRMPEVLKVTFGVLTNQTASTTAGLPIGSSAATFNTIVGATIASNSVSLPAGTQRISTSLSATINSTGANDVIVLSAATAANNFSSDVLARMGNFNTGNVATYVGTNYLNGSVILSLTAASTVYFNMFSQAGTTWSVSQTSPQSYGYIEKIH